MSDAGHSLVYTPPFCPEVQPIELLRAKVKRYVAARSTHNRYCNTDWPVCSRSLPDRSNGRGKEEERIKTEKLFADKTRAPNVHAR